MLELDVFYSKFHNNLILSNKLALALILNKTLVLYIIRFYTSVRINETFVLNT